MINVKHRKKSEGMSLEISGHANYADSGKDIVCASVSILLFALIDTVADIPGIEKKIEINDLEGNTLVEISKGSKKTFRTAKTAFDTVINGLDILAINYPAYVNVETV